MRQIKFRAWDEKTKTWVNPDTISITLSGIPMASEETWMAHNLADLVVHQYTGLHDRLGKEIYEGDIVKSTFYTPWNTMTVIWHEAGFGLTDGEGKFPLLSYETKWIKVIGNIYESLDTKRSNR